MLRRLAAWAALTLATSSLAGPAAWAETLADALARGYEASGIIEQNRALLRAADEDVAQAVATLRPVVSWLAQAQAIYPDPSPFGSTYTIGNAALTASLGLTASLTLYDGGGRRLGVEAQKEVVLATRQSLLGLEQQVLARVVAAYLDVQRQGAFVQLREGNLRLITQELRAARERFDVGETTRTDVALAEARLASARSQLAAEQGALARAQAEYRAAVGAAPSGALSAAPRAVVPATLAEARTIALRTHPSLLQAQHEVAAAEINVRRAEAQLRPSVQLQGRLQIDQDSEESAVATLQATGPIYQGGAQASQVRQFQARRDAARAGLLLAAEQIVQDVANAYANLEVARASTLAFEEQVRAAQVAFEGVREEASLGARTTLDVLDAEQDLLDARSALVSAQIDETTAGYQVLAAMGLLTARNLGLAVQVYDPSAYYDLVDDAPAAQSQQGRALDRVLEAIGQAD
jgi:outer membrane protein